MANKRLSLEDLYHPIFEKIYPKIETQRRGVLYHVLNEILNTDQAKAKSICDEYGIKSSATLNDDNKIVNQVTSNLEKLITMLNLKQQNLINIIGAGIKDRERFGIVATACKLVGPSSCQKYLEGGETPLLSPPPPPPPPIVVALCLVVPASVASNFRKNSLIDVPNIERLIDAASYFLCIDILKANNLHLETTNKEILSDSNLEVYVRIDIDDGKAMLDKTIRYILKRNLPSNEKGIIRELACLKSLSGLEVFNRV